MRLPLLPTLAKHKQKILSHAKYILPGNNRKSNTFLHIFVAKISYKYILYTIIPCRKAFSEFYIKTADTKMVSAISLFLM